MSSGSDGNTVTPATPAKPSDKQMNFLAVIMQNVQGKPDVNWANVVTQSGIKNERTAKEMYRQMTKKFGWGGTGAGSPSGSKSGVATTTPTKVRKRTGKVGNKSTKMKGGKMIQDDEDDGEDEEKANEGDEV